MAILIGWLQVLPSKMSYRIALVDGAPAVYHMCSRCLDDLGGQKSRPLGDLNVRGGFFPLFRLHIQCLLLGHSVSKGSVVKKVLLA